MAAGEQKRGGDVVAREGTGLLLEIGRPAPERLMFIL